MSNDTERADADGDVEKPTPRPKFSVTVRTAGPAIDIEAWVRAYLRVVIQVEGVAPRDGEGP